MNTTLSLKPILLTAAAAILCTGLQLTGIDTLAAPRSAKAEAHVQRLPTVLVIAQRDAAVATAVQQLPQVVVVARRDAAVATAVQQLPQVVVVARRLDRAGATTQALNAAAAGSAT